MSYLSSSYGGAVEPPLAHETYVFRDVLKVFKSHALRRAYYPPRIESRPSLRVHELARVISHLANEGMLRAEPGSRHCGPFQAVGYVMTQRGEEYLEALQLKNSHEIEARAKLHLLQRVDAANGPIVPHIGYITNERTQYLTKQLVDDGCLQTETDGKVRLTERGQKMMRAYEAYELTLNKK